jgi:DNA replication protein DnaC
MGGKAMARENAQRLFVVTEESDSAAQPAFLLERTESPLCAFCSGTSWEFVADKGVRPCRCRQDQRKDKLSKAANLPRLYEECSLSNYKPAVGNASQLRAFNQAYRIVESYPGDGRGLLLMGSCGVGKTHLAVAILRGLIEKGVQCLFYDFGALLKAIQSSYNPNPQTSELDILAPVFDAEVLVLDELGASKPTEWVLDTMLHIIRARYNDRRLTLFTSNYMDENSGRENETLEDRIGVRLRSRLYEMCRTVVIDGQDYRRHFDTQ